MATMRTCSVCGEQKLFDGFCFDDGRRYYCSAECLHKDFTPEEWEEAYDDGVGYYTTWEESVFYDVLVNLPGGAEWVLESFDSFEEARAFCVQKDWKHESEFYKAKWTLSIRVDYLMY